MRAVVIGAGVGGLAAAYELAKQGHTVHLVEASPVLGGQVRTFEIGGGRIESFYHHLFRSDTVIAELIEELGLGEDLEWRESKVGMLVGDRIFRFTGALDLLRFTPVSLLTRLRLGLSALWLRRVADWERYEGQRAAAWITRAAGREGYERVWGPLLRAKFGRHAPDVAMPWFWSKIYLRFASREGGPLAKEQLGYLSGSFGRMVDALTAAIEERGGTVLAGRPVRRVVVEDGRATGVELEPAEPGGEPELLPADIVVATVASPILARLAPELGEDYRALLEGVDYQWATVLVLALDRPLSEIYWLTATNADCPFVVAVEQTNFRDPAEYGGKHIVYFSNYADPGDPVTEGGRSRGARPLRAVHPPHQPLIRPLVDRRYVDVQGPLRTAHRAPPLRRDDRPPPHARRGSVPGEQHAALPRGPRPELHDADGHRGREDGGRRLGDRSRSDGVGQRLEVGVAPAHDLTADGQTAGAQPARVDRLEPPGQRVEFAPG